MMEDLRPSSQPTDRQLLGRIARQFAAILLIVGFFDTLLEWLFEGTHIIFELLHLLIEVCEHLLEELLEHLLHTNHHQSEIIIFNTAVLVFVIGIYRFFQHWPTWSQRWQQRVQSTWRVYTTQKRQDWQRLPARQKLLAAAAYTSGGVLLLFMLTL